MRHEIDITKITPSLSNPRKHIGAEELAELVASITEVGIIEPLVVRAVTIKGKKGDYAGNFEIICGERRFRAAEKAGLKVVPCEVREDLDEDQVENIQLHENLHRSDLDPIEESDVYNRLRDKGLTIAEIAQRSGKSETYVSRRLSLGNLIPDIRADYLAGHLSLTATAELAKYPEHAQQAVYSELYTPLNGEEVMDEEDFFNEIVEEVENSDDEVSTPYFVDDEWNDDALNAEAKKRFDAYMQKRQATAENGELYDKSNPRMGADRIRNWMNNELSARLDQFAFDMDDKRLRKDGLTCTDCRMRTGLSVGLFDDGQDEPIKCLDRECCAGKLDTFIQLTRKEMAKKAKVKIEDIPLATTGYLGYGEKRQGNLLYSEDYRKLDADAQPNSYYGMCKKAVDILIINSGAVIPVCIKSSACPTHFASSGRSSSREKAPEGSPLAEQQKKQKNDRKEEIWDVKVGEEVRLRVIVEASKESVGLTKTLVTRGLRITPIVARLWQLIGYSDKNVAKRFTDKAELPTFPDSYRTDYEEEAAKLTVDQSAQMLFILTHFWKGDMRGGSWSSQEPIKDLASEHGVNYKLIDAQVRFEFTPKKHEKKHKTYLDQVTVEDPTATIPRVYSEDYICPDDRPKVKVTESDEADNLLTEVEDGEYSYDCPECGRAWESDDMALEGQSETCPDCRDTVEDDDDLTDEDDAFGEAGEVEAVEEPKDNEPWSNECVSCGKTFDSQSYIEPDNAVCVECHDDADVVIAEAQTGSGDVFEADASKSVPTEIAEDLDALFDEAIETEPAKLARFVECGQCRYEGEVHPNRKSCPKCGASTSNVQFYDRPAQQLKEAA